MVAALALMALALARPQAGGRARLAKQRGLDLVVALDFSRSMLAKDIYPSRLERAKRELGSCSMDPGRRSGRRGGLRRRDADLSADHRLRGGEAVLARSPPLGHAGRRHRHRPRHQGVAGSVGRAAPDHRRGRDARAGDPAPHRRRGHRQRAARRRGRGFEAGREDLHRRHRVALGRADSRSTTSRAR